MVDSIYRTRSLGVAAAGLPDQYADGRAAKVWEYYIGSKTTRTDQYRAWITTLLQSKNCTHVLDVACGTGVDSILLLEEGFSVTSTDASDKMLKYALKERWNRRREDAFDKWVIEEANWLTLVDELKSVEGKPEGGYDVVVCLGNSFAHLPDFEGDQFNHKEALRNFYDMIKSGGVLVIDHRNYDEIIKTGIVPTTNLYYNSDHVTDIKCSNLYVNGKPSLVTLDYLMDMSKLTNSRNSQIVNEGITQSEKFRLSYYPHCLETFTLLLKEIFGQSTSHAIYGDFRPVDTVSTPAYYIHVIQKQ